MVSEEARNDLKSPMDPNLADDSGAHESNSNDAEDPEGLLRKANAESNTPTGGPIQTLASRITPDTAHSDPMGDREPQSSAVTVSNTQYAGISSTLDAAEVVEGEEAIPDYTEVGQSVAQDLAMNTGVQPTPESHTPNPTLPNSPTTHTSQIDYSSRDSDQENASTQAGVVDSTLEVEASERQPECGAHNVSSVSPPLSDSESQNQHEELRAKPSSTESEPDSNPIVGSHSDARVGSPINSKTIPHHSNGTNPNVLPTLMAVVSETPATEDVSSDPVLESIPANPSSDPSMPSSAELAYTAAFYGYVGFMLGLLQGWSLGSSQAQRPCESGSAIVSSSTSEGQNTQTHLPSCAVPQDIRDFHRVHPNIGMLGRNLDMLD